VFANYILISLIPPIKEQLRLKAVILLFTLAQVDFQHWRW
jgi:hypothetical protein